MTDLRQAMRKIGSAALYIVSRPFVYVFALLFATILSVSAIISRLRYPDRDNRVHCFDDSHFVRFYVVDLESTSVLAFHGYPFSWGYYANRHVTSEEIDFVREQLRGPMQLTRKERETFCTPIRRSNLFLEVFIDIAFARYVAKERKAQECAWEDAWDCRNTKIVLEWLTKGGNVNAQSQAKVTEGKTLLDLTRWLNGPKFKQMLLDHGAESNKSAEH